jgi:putative transposase
MPLFAASACPCRDTATLSDGERVIGTIRRECLDWLIPLSEAHLRRALRLWVEHYNRAAPT